MTRQNEKNEDVSINYCPLYYEAIDTVILGFRPF